MMEEVVHDGCNVTVSCRDLHHLADTASLEIEDIPSERSSALVANEAFRKFPERRDLCHLTEQPLQERLVVGWAEAQVAGRGWEMVE
jgi:hypothetical protein